MDVLTGEVNELMNLKSCSPFMIYIVMVFMCMFTVVIVAALYWLRDELEHMGYNPAAAQNIVSFLTSLQIGAGNFIYTK